MPICPLCNSNSKAFYKDEFYECSCCKAIFRPFEKLLDNEKEKQRYESHTNDADDLGYQNFVSPITNSVLNEFSKDDLGLDFGCGRNSPIVKVLRDKSFQIFEYDPYFFDDKSVLEKKYDYIAACEVIEHFYNPNIDFPKWWYKNDLTHVFIFQEETFMWIKKEFRFKDIKIEKNFIRLSK